MGMKKLVLFCLFALVCIWFFVLFEVAKHSPENRKIIFSNEAQDLFVFEVPDGKKTLRCLGFTKNGIVQGCVYPQMPEKIALDYVKSMLMALSMKELNENSKVLVLGMGIAMIPTEIAKFNPNIKLEIVELDGRLPALDEQYFGFNKTPNAQVFIEDAYNFVFSKNSPQYDVIFMDVFNESYIPPEFLTKEFIAKVRSLLKLDGIFVMNTFKNSRNFNLESELVLNEFGQFWQINSYNRIIFAGNVPEKENLRLEKNFATKIGFKKLKGQLELIKSLPHPKA